MTMPQAGQAPINRPQSRVWGVPFSPVTFTEAVDAVENMVSAGRANFIVTANLHYAMLSAGDARLRDNNERAALVLADGMPLVWASRWRPVTLPERVTGSDLLPLLCARAAERGWGVYFLGAAPGVAAEAAKNLTARFPGLRVVGIESPPFRALSKEEQDAQREAIRAARPAILFVAFGQPKGEYWVAENYEQLGVPCVMQIGASLDFAAGRVTRAPRWLQKIGMEWLYRFGTDPWRLGKRYLANAVFAARMLLKDLVTRRANRN
ncbi:MAG: WecB/TagA/CpsF family glycosyltransferase [Gemmataceae bacterium]|nr:WecB/TagA/CpsF family glycosyltransferase [Gemmataceae bacterium]